MISELLETHERPEDFSIDVDLIDACSAAEGPGHGVSFGWTGFKIVSDNIDKNLRPSYQRINHQTVSLHYFHSCAVGDRIDISFLSDIAKSHVSLCPSAILQSADDLDAIKKELQVLVSRYFNAP